MNRPRENRAPPYARRALVLVALVAASGGCASSERAQRANEIAALRGQVEELRRGQETNAREVARLSGELKAMDAQSAFLVGEAKTTAEELARIKAALEENRRVVGALRSVVESAEKPDLATTAASPSPSAPELYASALASVQVDESERALQELTALTKRFPEHTLASSAQYWIGEVYFRRGDFTRALVEFQRVVDGYPKTAQIPEALLKIGSCYRALKDQAKAREVWRQLTKEFPGTNAANQARALLGASDAGGRPARTGTR